MIVVYVLGHAALSALIAAGFVWKFGRSLMPVLSHAALVVEWDAVTVAAMAAAVVALPSRDRLSRGVCRVLPAVTFTTQIYLYVLNLVSNLSWGRNMSGQLATSFAPTIWSGREPFPVGRIGITVFLLGTLAIMLFASRWWGPPIHQRLGSALSPQPLALRSFAAGVIASDAVLVMSLVFAATVRAGVRSDNLPWKTELVASFLRPDAFGFEPTARRHAVAERDQVIRAAYPHYVPKAHLKNVVLIIVDSLRADRMQVYGYSRPTTPFLSAMVGEGRMEKVRDAFSTCSESFCGITSTLTGREFPDISPRDFQLHDVLRDEGYQTWFLLSGNHRAWNGLPQFYRASAGTFFDGSDTSRYTMDDDRLVLEGLEGVPVASPNQPAFFYMHLMSTHYLGVQFPESHVFTSADDRVSPGIEPYKILPKLNSPDRYDDKVRQVDDVIRQLFERLAAKHYLDEAVVVITGDHGEGLGERHWAHGWNLYNEDIRVPLLVYDVPAARYQTAFASQVDIAPTIVDRLGLPIPASWEGRSLLAPDVKRFSFHETFFIPHRFAVIYRSDEGLFKYIATPQYGREELYDLTRDAQERHDIMSDAPELAALMREKLNGYRLGK